MKNVTIWGGSGRIGTYVANALSCYGYKITIVDKVPPSAGGVEHKTEIDMSDVDILINTLPHTMNDTVMAALESKPVHYYDLSEDVNYSKQFIQRNPNYPKIFMPHCGLAPGLINIRAAEMIRRSKLKKIEDCHMAVGALPVWCDNYWKHAVNWSVEGLINEYTNPCTVLREGVLTTRPALSGCNPFLYKGVPYESFYTSVGIGTMCETFKEEISNMAYSSIRYQGHREQLSTIKYLKSAFTLIPIQHQSEDLVIMSIVLRDIDGKEERYIETFEGFEGWSAIQRMTGDGLLLALDGTINSGRIGFIKQESF
jgi:saccharopine dehydrogenase-like NADP-dependent oxidoreductase